MKKIFAFLLTAIMTISIVGCSTSDKDKTSDESKTEFKVVKMEDVKKAIKDKNSVVVDARSPYAYMGWTMDNDKRGGHIPGATDFSSSFLDYKYDEKKNLEEMSREEVLMDMQNNKKITSDKNVIVYDTNGEDAQKVAEYFASKHIKNVSIYNATEWVNDKNLELESYPNYKMLVPPTVAKAAIDGEKPETFKDAKHIKVFDIRWGDNEKSGYLDGHIPQALHINTDSIEPPVAYDDNAKAWLPQDKTDSDKVLWRLASDEDLLKLMLDNGITKDTTVICTSPEPMASSRFAVVCKYMGVKDVRVLGGTLEGWTNAGYELSKENLKAVAAKDFGVKTPADPSWIDTIDQAAKGLKDKDNYILVDNRTKEEREGKSTGYSYHKIAGAIEGSIFGYAGKKSSSSVSYYRNIDKTMRNGYEIKDMWNNAGVDTNKRLAFMCGSGWRVSEILWDAKIMGYDNTCIYSDGWIGWSNEDRPIVSGIKVD